MRENEETPRRGLPQQRRHLSPFVACADGPLVEEAKILPSDLSTTLAKKWEKPCSEVCGYDNVRMSVAAVRARPHLCARGSRIPAGKVCNRLPQWEDKAGLGLFHH